MDHYSLLGVPRDISTQDLTRTYLLLALKCHPDKLPNDPNATANFQRVQNAYETLKDPRKRQLYDIEVFETFSTSPAPSEPAYTSKPESTSFDPPASHSSTSSGTTEFIQWILISIHTEWSFMDYHLHMIHSYLSREELSFFECESQFAQLDDRKATYLSLLRSLRTAQTEHLISEQVRLGSLCQEWKNMRLKMKRDESWWEGQYQEAVKKEGSYWEHVSSKLKQQQQSQHQRKQEQEHSNFGSAMDIDNDNDGPEQAQPNTSSPLTQQDIPQRGPAIGTCLRAHTFDYGNAMGGVEKCNLCKRPRDTFFKCTTCGGIVCQACSWM